MFRTRKGAAEGPPRRDGCELRCRPFSTGAGGEALCQQCFAMFYSYQEVLTNRYEHASSTLAAAPQADGFPRVRAVTQAAPSCPQMEYQPGHGSARRC